jgi:hypothetical protein
MNQGSALASLRRAGTEAFGWRVNQVRKVILGPAERRRADHRKLNASSLT